MISSTSPKVAGSITSPPRRERVVSRLEGVLVLVLVSVFLEVVGVPAQKRLSAHDFFSGKMLFPDTLEIVASAMVKMESFIFVLLRLCSVVDQIEIQ